MAIGPYDQPQQGDFSFVKYTPQSFAPDFSMLEQALSEMQSNYTATMSALGSVMPKHIEEDEELVQEYQKKLEEQILGIRSAYKEGGIDAGRLTQQEALMNLQKDMTSGDYAAFEARLKEKQQLMEEIEEDYKDNETLQHYFKQNIIAEPFKREDGSYGHVRLGVAKYRDIPIEDITAELRNAADMIKEGKLVTGPNGEPLPTATVKALDKYTNVYDIIHYEGIDMQRAIEVLQNALPEDMIRSLQQMHVARQFNAGVPIDQIDPTEATRLYVEVENEETGEMETKFNAASELGRIIYSQASAVAHIKDKHHYVKGNTGDSSAARDAELAAQRQRMRTAIFANNLAGRRNVGLRINSKGEVFVRTPRDTWQDVRLGYISGEYSGYPMVQRPEMKMDVKLEGSIDEFFNDPTKLADQIMPYEYQAYQQLSKSYVFNTASDKEKIRMLTELGDQIYQDYQNLHTDYVTYDVDQRDAKVEWLFGSRPTATGNQVQPTGAINGSTIIVNHPKEGKKAYTYENFKNEFDLSDLEVQQYVQLLGETTTDDVSVLQDGIVGILTFPKESNWFTPDTKAGVYVVIANTDPDRSEKMIPIHELSEPLVDPGKPHSNAVQALGIPQLDLYAPTGYVSRLRQVTNLTQIEDQMVILYEQYRNATKKEEKRLIKEKMDHLDKQKKELLDNPMNIRHITSELDITDPDGKPIYVPSEDGESQIRVDMDMILYIMDGILNPS